MASVSYDTGKYSKEGVQTFMAAVEDAKQLLLSDKLFILR